MHKSLLAIALLLIIAPLFPASSGLTYDHVSAKIDADLTVALANRGPQAELQILVTSNQLFTREQILELGHFGQVTSVTGHVAVLRTRGIQVPKLAGLDFIASLEGPRNLQLQLDVSVPDIGVPDVTAQIRDAGGSPIDGKGVIVGIADTGIDLTHPDFKFADGTTKILYLWDQSEEGTRSSLVSYGSECTKADIDGGRCGEYDLNGHGTHVTGIAASSGLATGKYAGVAPGANIVFVKIGEPACEGTSWTATEANIIDAFSYILSRAKEMGMRAVGSLSFGSLVGGGHDGTSAFERGLDDIISQGLPIATSAGNSQGDDAHITGKLSQGQSITGGWEATSTSGSAEAYFMEIWYDTQDLLDLSITSPGGQTVTGPTPAAGVSRADGRVYIFEEETEKGRGWTVVVEKAASAESLRLSGWEFTLTGRSVRSEGTWDAWVDVDSCSVGAQFTSGEGYSIDNSKTVGLPGTANEIITVGSYVTRSRWTSKGGSSISRGGAIGQLSTFSSIGPTRDGRMKPDIVAPGQWIISAASRYKDAVLTLAIGRIAPDDFHIPLQGTSMSAPHAAGVIALMLQFNPALTSSQVRETLRKGARQDFATGNIDPDTGNSKWGWGKIDARTAAGMFRVTVIASGLPTALRTSVYVDGVNKTAIGGGRRAELAFPQASSHVVSVDDAIVEKEGVRYKPTLTNMTVRETSVIDLKYVKQYLLRINARSATGDGWYDAGTTVTFGAPDAVPVDGFYGVIGGRFRLVQWLNDKNQTMNETRIEMDGPHNLTAIYVEDLSLAYATLGGIVAAVAVIAAAVVLLQVRKRKKAQ